MIAHQHPVPDVPAAVRTVAITDVTVVPNSVVVPPGTNVTWHNDGRNRHTVTADGGAFGSGVLVPGDQFTLSAPAAPGVYAYHCRFHSFIRGTLTVSLVSLATPAPVVVGGRPALTGTVPDATLGTPVRVELRVPGAWQDVGTTTTGSGGVFQLTGPPLSARAAFRAVTGESISPSIRAEVRPAVTLTRRGARVVVRVKPAPRGGSAHL